MAWHVVIAGGGFAGFYAARSLERKPPRDSARITIVNDTNSFPYTPLLPGASETIELYPRCRVQGMRWILVEREGRIMPEVRPSLSDFATTELRRRGIEVRTGTSLEAVTADSATLSGGEVIPTRTVAWTAGV